MNLFEKEYYEHEGFWNSEGFNESNQERIRFTASKLPLDVSTILDAGCGNGLFPNYLAKLNPDLKITAMDRSQAALSHVLTEKICADITRIPFRDRFFDCVSALEIIEHLPVDEYEQAKREIARVAKKYLLISVPNDQHLEDDMTQCPGCRTIFNPDLHLRSFNVSLMKKLMDTHGFYCLEVLETGKTEVFFAHDRYSRWRNRKTILSWKSPICPLCGYKEASAGPVCAGLIPKASPGIVQALKKIPKFFWPKVSRGGWLIGLYQRSAGLS